MSMSEKEHNWVYEICNECTLIMHFQEAFKTREKSRKSKSKSLSLQHKLPFSSAQDANLLAKKNFLLFFPHFQLFPKQKKETTEFFSRLFSQIKLT